MVKRHKGKLKRAPPASHLATSPLAEVEPKGSEVRFGEMSPGGEAFMASNSGATLKALCRRAGCHGGPPILVTESRHIPARRFGPDRCTRSFATVNSRSRIFRDCCNPDHSRKRPCADKPVSR